MAKNIIGFNSEDDFDRMSRSVRKSESTPQVGQRQRAKYPLGGAPTVKRGVISELGDYDVHLITLLSGTFTEDLTTDGLEHTFSDVTAYVANEFDYHLNVGDIVLLAKISGQYWIIDAEPDCNGYCIDENFTSGETWVYGWSFRAPNLPCCPEAGGVHLLTTSDSGVTYESATFECNSDGTTRKWLFNDRKLRLTPRLDEGNLEWWTDNAPTSCTVQLQAYEPQRAPTRSESCGKVPQSVCLHPMCGVGTCSKCSNKTSPMVYTAIISGGGDETASVGVNTCSGCEGTYQLHRLVTSSGDQCQWSTLRSESETVSLSVSGSNFILTCGSMTGAYWSASGPLDCSEEFTLTYNSYGSPEYCENGLDATIIPSNGNTLEGNCYPSSHGGFTANSVDYCDLVPYTLELELTGLTNGTCTDCSLLNDVHRINLDNTYNARWIGGNISSSCLSTYSTTPGFVIVIDFTTIYLKFGSTTGFYSASVVYTMSVTNFNCNGPNVFTKNSASGECTGWPATITIYPMVSTI